MGVPGTSRAGIVAPGWRRAGRARLGMVIVERHIIPPDRGLDIAIVDLLISLLYLIEGNGGFGTSCEATA